MGRVTEGEVLVLGALTAGAATVANAVAVVLVGTKLQLAQRVHDF